jgi:excisionase family DNA binding protein
LITLELDVPLIALTESASWDVVMSTLVETGNQATLRELTDIYQELQGLETKLVGPDGTGSALPSNLYSFLRKLLNDLRAGNSVSILRAKAELTTVEAGKLLGMSRQFLIKLLERGEIPFHMVGSHRRMYARDVLAYKTKRDANRRKILDDLARTEQEQGTYDRVPDDFNAQQ